MKREAKKTILLVEDEFLIAMAEKTSLEMYGYSVIRATTGEGAWMDHSSTWGHLVVGIVEEHNMEGGRAKKVGGFARR